ncbi:TetR family transcriptional regulator [Variovorax terrae]|uniref:TetR family transcriptional regulator n=1 Tax=Variovorax terrae TaxID=2923278 RepID=A0A9X2ARX7_9BURK|nr:TetR family transcriptional regulator [Variovorax terrae]MCJ0764631.1 TetR family transcriptional regulator [Variovorax terrae]
MVRRTKEDALATRNSLLDSAEILFQAHGVSRTSLNDIAQAAGTTRGAIYWHFKDKADLFNAMMERVTLPMEDALLKVDDGIAADPVKHMRAAMLHALHKTAHDEQTRRVFEVATHKVEYVDELSAVRERHLSVRNECLTRVAQDLRAAARQRGHRLPIPAPAAAHGLHALIDGLIQNWLLDPQAFDLVATGRKVFDTYLSGLGLAGDPQPAAADEG